MSGVPVGAAPIAVIDIGSNSIRLAVVVADRDGHLEVVEEGRAIPRLIRDVRATGSLSAASIDLVLSTLRAFMALARGAGADRIITVATSAVRDATNSEGLVSRAAEELGLTIDVIPGTSEAEFSFAGAVHGLPVSDGLVIDIGGGSMEVVHFEGRVLRRSWTLPLGAVRLTDEFALADPPDGSALAALSEHARRVWHAEGIPPLVAGAHFVGTGGTVRNLAKLDRANRAYSLPRLHGYALGADRLRAIADTLGRSANQERAGMQGLNPDRADTIVAGAVAVLAALDAAGADALLISGQGLREGVALRSSGYPAVSLPHLRATALERLQRRFDTSMSAASRRNGVIEALRHASNVQLSVEIADALKAASALLDLGRTVDYYTRHRQTEAIIAAHGLPGFSHREVALICALIRQSGSERYSALAYEPLVTPADAPAVLLGGTLLSAADEVVLATGSGQEIAEVDQRADRITLIFGGQSAQELPMSGRFRRAFGANLVIRC